MHGINAADINTASINEAGINAAGINAAGINAASINAAGPSAARGSETKAGSLIQAQGPGARPGPRLGIKSWASDPRPKVYVSRQVPRSRPWCAQISSWVSAAVQAGIKDRAAPKGSPLGPIRALLGTIRDY